MCIKSINTFLYITAVLSFPLCYGGENLLTNPGFETGTTSGCNSFGSSISAVTAPHSGTHSALVTGRTATWNGIRQTMLGLVSNGQTCTISGWAKLENTSSDLLKLTVKQTDDGGTHYHPIDSATGNNSTWTYLSGDFTLDVNGVLADLFLYFEGPAADVNFYVDDASLIGPAPDPNHADARVDAVTRYQRIEGFGAAGVHYVNWLQAHPDKIEIYDVIFRQLGLDILRIGNAYDHNDGAARIAGWAELVAAAETSLCRPIKVMITSGSPPAHLKSNNDTSGGTLARYPGAGYKYDQFAQWWADSLEYYSSSGIKCEYVSMQNEPDYIDVWDTCKFTPAETSEWAGYNEAFEALYQKLDSRMSEMPKLLAPETIGFGSSQAYIDALTDANHVYGFAHHLYGDGDYNQPDSFVPDMQNYSAQYGYKPLLQTEFAAASGVSFQAALIISRHIHNSLVYEGVSSYCYWDLFWGDSGGLVTIEFPWQSNPGYTINPVYYAFKNYSAFIHSGWRRLEASTDSPNPRISAYISPDNKQLTVVIINTDADTNVELDLSFNNFSVEDGNVYRTSSMQNCELIGDFNDSGPLILPAESITTLALFGTLILTDCQQVQDAGLNLAGDLDGNCYVNLADVSVLTDQWLSSNPIAIPPNHTPDILSDNKVNLSDLAVLTNDWLNCNNPQDSNCIKNW